MKITELIKHPETMDRDTLYELRSMLALYPYFQTARLLMLQNLYLLHDSTFDEELRKAAIYITDRKVIFRLIEAAHYQLHPTPLDADTTSPTTQQGGKTGNTPQDTENRTIRLIDNFLNNMPKNNEEDAKAKEKRKPTPADAAIDYVAYLLESEEEYRQAEDNAPQMVGQELIDSFINSDNSRIVLSDSPQLKPQLEDDTPNTEKTQDEECFTETLARIYIKQGRYSKALEIIQRLSLENPKKNAYFADQIRFIQKLIINSNNNKK